MKRIADFRNERLNMQEMAAVYGGNPHTTGSSTTSTLTGKFITTWEDWDWIDPSGNPRQERFNFVTIFEEAPVGPMG